MEEIEGIEIEMDSLVAIDLVLANKHTNVFLSSVVHDCGSLIGKFVSSSLKHVYQEANGCADLLVKVGYDQLVDYISFSTPPALVLEAVQFDLSDCTHTGLISC